MRKEYLVQMCFKTLGGGNWVNGFNSIGSGVCHPCDSIEGARTHLKAIKESWEKQAKRVPQTKELPVEFRIASRLVSEWEEE